MAATLVTAAFAGCSGKAPAISSSVTSTAAPSESPKSVSGSCTLWTWDTTEKSSIQAFNKLYPNVQVNTVSVGYDDYLKKIMTAVASGGELPDIIDGDYGFRAELFKLGICENLDQAPYNVNKSDIVDYEVPLSTYNNHIVALGQAITPGGIAYKADLAKKYLGTDDPAQLEKELGTWDDYVKAGKKVQAESNGKVYLFHAWADIQEILDCAGTEPFTRDNKPTDYLLNADPAGRYNLLESMLKNGCFDKTISAHYTPAMNNAIADNNHIMLDCAPWTSAFVLQPNDKSSGRWRLIKAPISFNMGGTAYCINKNSKNKAAAWAYVGWACYSTQGGEAMLATRGYFPSYKPLVASHNYSKDSDKMFGGQNVTEKFIKEMSPDVKVRPLEVYRNQVCDSFHNAESALINDKSNSVTLGQFRQIVLKELKSNCPDLDW